jgi:hypothetical protein
VGHKSRVGEANTTPHVQVTPLNSFIFKRSLPTSSFFLTDVGTDARTSFIFLSHRCVRVKYDTSCMSHKYRLVHVTLKCLNLVRLI